jgi:hypothetical protein
MKLIVCDLDGTLSDCRHREHLVPDWEAFHAKMGEDKPHKHVLWILEQLLFAPEPLDTVPLVLFLTGRPEVYRQPTVDWLQDKCGLAQHDDYALWMRPTGQFGSDVDVKVHLLEEFLKFELILNTLGEVTKEEILILEDREKVVTKWRDLGYECWQVREGAW